jgi:RNA polymerase sigma-70 factor, ECF subfamily
MRARLPDTERVKVVGVADADATLVLRCKSNDAAAFDDIVARYQHKVYNYVCRMIGAIPDAEDLAQDTFVRAFMSIRSFESRASLNTWLYRIATNLCIDYTRRSRKVKAITTSLYRETDDDGVEIEHDVPDSRYEPEAIALNTELGVQLDAALARLSDKLRAVVVLHDIEGLQYDEIARVVNCPMGTVKSRLFAARSELRERLSPYLTGVPVPPRAERAPNRRGAA